MAISVRYGFDLSVDEPFTALSAQRPVSELLGDVWPHDNTPVTYLLLKLSTPLTGRSEMGLRLPFILAYTLAVVLAGLTTSRIAGDSGGLLAAVMVATSGRIGLLHAATVRPYALLCFLSALSAWQLVRVIKRPDPRQAIGLAVVQIAGLLAHPTYVFVATAVLVAVVFGVEGRTARIRVAVTVLGAVLLYFAAWGPVLARTLQLPATAWMPPPAAAGLWNGYLLLWGNRTGFVLAGVLLAVVTMAEGDAIRSLRKDRTLWAITAGAVVALSAPWLASWVKPVFVVARTPILALPWLAIAIAVVVSRVAGRRLAAGLVIVFAAAALQFVSETRRAGDPAPTRTAVSAVLSRAQCGDVLITAGLSFAPVAYYLERLAAPPCVRMEPFPASVRAHPGWVDERNASEATYSDDAGRFLSATRPEPGRQMFAFLKRRGIGSSASLAIVDRLRGSCVADRELPMAGSFFDHVAVFRACAARDARSKP